MLVALSRRNVRQLLVYYHLCLFPTSTICSPNTAGCCIHSVFLSLFWTKPSWHTYEYIPSTRAKHHTFRWKATLTHRLYRSSFTAAPICVGGLKTETTFEHVLCLTQFVAIACIFRDRTFKKAFHLWSFIVVSLASIITAPPALRPIKMLILHV